VELERDGLDVARRYLDHGVASLGRGAGTASRLRRGLSRLRHWKGTMGRRRSYGAGHIHPCVRSPIPRRGSGRESPMGKSPGPVFAGSTPSSVWTLTSRWFTAETGAGRMPRSTSRTLPEQCPVHSSGIPEVLGARLQGVLGVAVQAHERSREMKSVRGAAWRTPRILTGVDLYRHRSQWYLMEDGQWFHSDSWKGPFMAVPVSQSPARSGTSPFSTGGTGQTSAIG
jgi:hypothetical protein